MIAWLNKQPKCKIFTIKDISDRFEDLSKSYINRLINDLSNKEFYIGKNYSKDKPRKIDSFYKKINIPTDKTLEDIKWFLRTGI